MAAQTLCGCIRMTRRSRRVIALIGRHRDFHRPGRLDDGKYHLVYRGGSEPGKLAYGISFKVWCSLAPVSDNVAGQLTLLGSASMFTSNDHSAATKLRLVCGERDVEALGMLFDLP